MKKQRHQFFIFFILRRGFSACSIYLLICLLLSVVQPMKQVSAFARALPANNNSQVLLKLVDISTISISGVAQKGIKIVSLLQNASAYPIMIRSGCIGPVVHLSKGNSQFFEPKLYVGLQHSGTDSCIPTMKNISSHSSLTLNFTYLLQDSRQLSQFIPSGTYRIEEELTFTVIKGSPAKRYKKLSDNEILDTFPTKRVYSDAQMLTLNSNSTVLTHTNYQTAAVATLLQSISGNAGSVNPSLTFPSSVQTGNLIIAAINCGNRSLGLPKDSLGNIWASSASQTSGLGYRQSLYYAIAAANGNDTITFTCHSRSSFAIAEFSGLESSPFDQSGTARGTSAPGVTTASSTTQAYELVIGFVGDNLTLAHSYTVMTFGYSEIQQNDSTHGNIELAYTSTSAEGRFTTSWQSSRPVAWGALQTTFRIAPPPLTYPQNSIAGPFTPKAVVIDYNTSGQPGDGSAALTQRLISDWGTGSNFHGASSSSVNLQIYATYEENNPPPILPGTSHGNLTGDYQAVFNKYNICNLAATQGVNFVWIWASGSEQGGINYSADFFEWVATGPTFYQAYWSNAPTCGSHTVVTFGFNYSRAAAEALHSTGHYMENLLQFTFGPSTDLSSGTPGGTDMYDLFDGQVSRYNGYNGPLNTQTAECGDVHFPPNTVTAYDYGNNSVVWSYCSDYNPGNPSSELYWEVSAGSWQGIPCDPSLGFGSFDCDQESYLMWWMQNMPGYNNGVEDLYQYAMPNWWQYIVALDTTIRYN